jgi:hypothetical protein
VDAAKAGRVEYGATVGDERLAAAASRLELATRDSAESITETQHEESSALHLRCGERTWRRNERNEKKSAEEFRSAHANGCSMFASQSRGDLFTPVDSK